MREILAITLRYGPSSSSAVAGSNEDLLKHDRDQIFERSGLRTQVRKFGSSFNESVSLYVFGLFCAFSGYGMLQILIILRKREDQKVFLGHLAHMGDAYGPGGLSVNEDIPRYFRYLRHLEVQVEPQNRGPEGGTKAFLRHGAEQVAVPND